jgi:hypothetical protein
MSRSGKIASWLQVSANLGILAGLILVGLQMQQNEELLRVQIMNQHYTEYIAADTAIAGENVAIVWQKSIEDPGGLSLAEQRSMESQTYAPLNRWINLYRMYEAGLLDESEWQIQVDLDAPFYFGNPYTRAWWDESKAGWPKEWLPLELKDYLDKRLERVSISNNREYYGRISALAQKYEDQITEAKNGAEQND